MFYIFVYYVQFFQLPLFSKFYNIIAAISLFRSKKHRFFKRLQNGYKVFLCRLHSFNKRFMFDIYEKMSYNSTIVSANHNMCRARRKG